MTNDYREYKLYIKEELYAELKKSQNLNVFASELQKNLEEEIIWVQEFELRDELEKIVSQISTSKDAHTLNGFIFKLFTLGNKKKIYFSGLKVLPLY